MLAVTCKAAQKELAEGAAGQAHCNRYQLTMHICKLHICKLMQYALLQSAHRAHRDGVKVLQPVLPRGGHRHTCCLPWGCSCCQRAFLASQLQARNLCSQHLA